MRRKREIEDPNNTWNMQLMVAVCGGDTTAADDLLLKGAKIEHFAPANISSFPALAQNSGTLGNLMNNGGLIGLNPAGGARSVGGAASSNGDIMAGSTSFENVANPQQTPGTKDTCSLPPAATTMVAPFNPAVLTYPRSTTNGGLYMGVAPTQNAFISGAPASGAGGVFSPTASPQKGDRLPDDTVPTASSPAGGKNSGGQVAGGVGASLSPSPSKKLNIAGVDPEDPHVYDPSIHVKITPFLAAILHHDLDTASWVAQHGGNSNCQFNDGANGTILHFLVRTDNAALLELVCSHIESIDDGAMSLDTRDASCGMTAVELALFLHKPEMARILLMYGCADPFKTLVDGRYTATQRACITGNIQVLQTYLSAGDNIRQKDQVSGETLFHLGILHPQIIDYLVDVCASISCGAVGGMASIPGSSPGVNPHLQQQRGRLNSITSGGGSRPPSNSSLNKPAATTNNNAVSEEQSFNINTAVNARGETPLVFAIRYLCNASPHLPGLNGAVSSNGPPSTPSKPSDKKAAAAVGSGHSVSHPDPVAAATSAGVIPVQDIGQYLALGQPAMPTTFGPIGGTAALEYNANLAQHALVALGILPGGVLSTPMFNAGNGVLSVDPTSLGGGGITLSAVSLGQGTPKSGVDLVDFLIAKGADATGLIPDSSPMGMSPLMHAILAYAPEVLKRLIVDLKVPLAVRDCLGSTALHYAVNALNRGTLELLLNVEVPADVNAQDRRGETALHRAAARGNVSAIEFLLQLPSTDVNMVDAEGRNPLHTAVVSNQLGSVEALLKRCAVDIGVPVVEKGKKTAPKKGQVQEFTVPQRLHIDTEDTTPKRQTPLQIAVECRFNSILYALVTVGGASVERPSSLMPITTTTEDTNDHHTTTNAPPLSGDLTVAWRDVMHSGGTILHEAVLMQNVDLVRLLLDKGGNVLARNAHDRTPLHLACCPESQRLWRALSSSTYTEIPDRPAYGSAEVSHAIVAMLVERGSLVVDQDIYSLTTPLHLASRSENVELVTLLLSKIVSDATSSIPKPQHQYQHVPSIVDVGSHDESTLPSAAVTAAAAVTKTVSATTGGDDAGAAAGSIVDEKVVLKNLSEIKRQAAQDAMAMNRYQERITRAVQGALRYAVGIQDCHLQSALHVAMIGNEERCSALIHKSMVELPGMSDKMGSKVMSTLPLIHNFRTAALGSYDENGLYSDESIIPDDTSSARLRVLRAIVDTLDVGNGKISTALREALFQSDFDGCTPLHRLCMSSASATLASQPQKERLHRAQVNLLNYLTSLFSENDLESALWLTDSRGWTAAHAAVAFSGDNQLLITALLEMYTHAPQAASSQPPATTKAKTIEACTSLADIKDRFSSHIVRAGGQPVNKGAPKPKSIVTHPDAHGRNLVLLAADYGRVDLSRLLVRSFKSSTTTATK